MSRLTTHGCGKKWLQRGNRTGHCGGCHETFEGLALFDAHFDRSGGGLVCRDPREMTFRGEALVFDPAYGDGSWHATRTEWDTSVFQCRGGVIAPGDDSDVLAVTSEGVAA